MTCADCGAESAGAARFCAACGAALEPSTARRTQAPSRADGPVPPTATLAAVAHAAGRPSGPAAGTRSPSFPSDSLDHGRFLPGQLLSERYRIVGLLGRGGMGEVYRADDLRLGQTVALKFLPPELAADPVRLARFHNEVRLARQVTHPNVCRVHDIGDIDGQPYLSMEYVDGEDLSSLLRRIGRLPKDKAVEIARQVCAGLAAAHEQGVLHRDLKPSNVMLDGRGRARLADFGLAAASGEAEHPGSRAGTPAYMAPEILSGGEASARSDIYALGLVLYELFTGKRVFAGKSFAEIVHQQEAVDPTPPSLVVEDFDPVVERVILRCLEKDPKRRPATVLAVSAGLPGGDPLAMALLAGETPSPEMVAAAGESGALKPGAAWACVAAAAAGLVLAALMMRSSSILAMAQAPKPPDVLVDRAQTVLHRAGYAEPPLGTGRFYGWHRTWVDHLAATNPAPDRWTLLAKPVPPVFFFFYRQSPRYLIAKNSSGIPTDDDPPALVPGMASVTLTGTGDLWKLHVVPPQVEQAEGSAPAADWGVLFEAAGLSLERFRPAVPHWLPQDYADQRAAWEGTHSAAPDVPLRVEAASYRGRPIYFEVLWPWNRPLREQPFEPSLSDRVGNGILIVLIAAALLGGLSMARQNLRLGRGDRRGAIRLAIFVFLVSFAAAAARATHVPRVSEEWDLLVRLMGGALFRAGTTWIYYLALEPLVRRRWPDTMIGWTRLIAGRVRDPLVGRDLLVGVLGGIGVTLSNALPGVLLEAIGRPLPTPTVVGLDAFQGPALWVAILLDQVAEAVTLAMLVLLLLVQLRVVLRRDWAAGAGLALIVAVVQSLTGARQVEASGVVAAFLLAGVVALVLVRFGVLALATTMFVAAVMDNFPWSLSLAGWYSSATLFALAVLAAIVAHALRSTLAGRPLVDVRAATE